MQRYFIYLAYDGTNYHGWQIQPNGSSVQECLMKALSTFLRRDVEVIGAGRTDAGVHASLMVSVREKESRKLRLRGWRDSGLLRQGAWLW